MNPNHDDSAAARENPDDTVWPPPPLGPRVVAIRPQPRFLFSLPVPESLSGFKLPKWAKSAWNNLVVAFLASWIYVKSPMLIKILLGCFIIGDGILILVFFLSAGTVGYIRVAFAVTGQAMPPPEKGQKGLTPTVWFEMAPHLMLFVWGLCFLFRSHLHLITWTALVFWLALIVAGVGVAVVNGVKHWLLSRRQSTG